MQPRQRPQRSNISAENKGGSQEFPEQTAERFASDVHSWFQRQIKTSTLGALSGDLGRQRIQWNLECARKEAHINLGGAEVGEKEEGKGSRREKRRRERRRKGRCWTSQQQHWALESNGAVCSVLKDWNKEPCLRKLHCAWPWRKGHTRLRLEHRLRSCFYSRTLNPHLGPKVAMLVKFCQETRDAREKEASAEEHPIRTPHGRIWRAFSWWKIDTGGPRWLWATPPLGRRPWFV